MRVLMATLFTFFLILDLGSALAREQPSSEKKPNIVFIIADDLAYDCVGYAGNNEIQTPNIDLLARQSTNFTHAYNMGGWNGAICLASRAMLNTGTFLWRSKEISKTMKESFVPKRRMWSQRMKDAGYETYFTGKWHVKASPPTIFDHVKHVRPGMPNQVKAGYDRPKNRDDKSWVPWDTQHEGFWKGGKHWSEVVADDTLEFLDNADKQDKPYFMYVAFNAPHDPRQSPKSFVERYPVDNVQLPQPFYERHAIAQELGLFKIRDERLAPYPRTEYGVRVNRQEYYAIITHLDQEIGRILQRIKKSKSADNTIIVFYGRPWTCGGSSWAARKANLYEHSLRVPFLVSGPNIEKSKNVASPIYMQDVMPTALQWAGADTKGVSFKSLSPLLKGESTTVWPSIYGAYVNQQRCIVKDHKKLIVYPTINRIQLFDLKKIHWKRMTYQEMNRTRGSSQT